MRDALTGLSEDEQALVSIDTVFYQTDPFYGECRAYGRRTECGLNGKVAVRCYGHLAIPADRAEELAQRFNVDDWDRPHGALKNSSTKRQPFRAIVKNLVRNDVALNDKILRKMNRVLVRMRKLGVYPMDVRLRNYGAGLLLGMSISVTQSKSRGSYL